MRFPDELRILGSAGAADSVVRDAAATREQRSARTRTGASVERRSEARGGAGKGVSRVLDQRAPLRIWPRAW